MYSLLCSRAGSWRTVATATLTIGLLVSIQLSAAGVAQDPTGLWIEARQRQTSLQTTSYARGERAPRYLLNEELLKAVLARAPIEDPLRLNNSWAPVLALPLPDGGFGGFTFVESPIMEPGLARRYPQIRTFRIRAADGSTIGGRAALTPLGFYAMILTPRGPIHVTPDSGSPTRLYTSVFEHDVATEPVLCSVQEPTPGPAPTANPRGPGLAARRLDPGLDPHLPLAVSGTELRDYRIAVATTSEYYFGRGGNDLDVLVSIIVELLRVDAIYESELSISFTLIQDTDLLFFTDPDAYLQDGVACNLKDENQGVVDSVLNDDDYDVAIVLDARSNTGGGCASGSGVCVSNSKARVAAGLDTTRTPGHESFGGYRLMLHEIGHIFGAGHTWSGLQGNCTDDQFAPNSAYEPGSGNTVMSYSGTCGSLGDDDIQNTTADPYFHIWSIDQIVNFSTTGNGDNCPATTATGNQPPTVDAGPDYTIPRNTPFVLSGSGSDPDGDDLTFTWEEFDLAADRFDLGTDDGVGPIIRSRIPGASADRTVPPLSDLFSGVSSPGELLPQVNRDLTFRLTARDNRAGGGGVNDDTMQITVDGPPFAIVSPNGGEVLPAGCAADVQWTVGGGDVAASVDLDLTMDEGATFTPLAWAVANDGQHELSNIGCFESGSARLRASAVGNIFFDISDGDFYIVNNPPEVEVSASGGSVDDECAFEVTFEATVTDDCGVSAADVEVSVDLLSANATLGVPTVNISQIDASTVSVTGSVMVSDLTGSPAQVGVSVTGTDNCGNETTEADVAEVEDNTPPTITVALSPDVIFPANHKLVDVFADVEAQDNCDPNPEIVLLSVISNEPENGQGDGNTAPDIAGADLLTADFEFQVRAERMQLGNGRIYTAEYGAADFSGNTAEDSATVTVPKDNSPASQP